ncbi:UPF0134 protein MPN_524 [Elysia marginata]|uniref:UPF0134 protein MPN_524 n=1 Tax=Elysia marginata TaxID=1093978 RepID=A0AAV4FN86_9GAST|nr:UPF0134 protein MPN_524 [Elysia marginata]
MSGHGRSEISTGLHTHNIMVILIGLGLVMSIRSRNLGLIICLDMADPLLLMGRGKKSGVIFENENGDTCKLVRAVRRSPEKVEPAMVEIMKILETAMGGIIQRIESMEERLRKLDILEERMDRMDTRMRNTEEKIDKMDVKMDHLEGRVGEVERCRQGSDCQEN